jgi:hypothetical protein
LDLFPASLVDNIIITKTASPDLPGDWAGAYLSVETKTKRKQIKKLVGPIIDFCNEINISNLPKEAHLFTNTETRKNLT